jgi:Zn-dependent M16 (insulinase) family peptidase
VTSTFGFQIVQTLMPLWIHEMDPIEVFKTTKYISLLRERLAQEPFFQNLIKKYLLNNPHKLTLIMNPGGLKST